MLWISADREKIVKQWYEPIISQRASGLVQSVLVLFKVLQSACLVKTWNVEKSEVQWLYWLDLKSWKAVLHMRTARWNVNMQDFLFNQLGQIDGIVCVCIVSNVCSVFWDLGWVCVCVCVVGVVMISFER